MNLCFFLLFADVGIILFQVLTFFIYSFIFDTVILFFHLFFCSDPYIDIAPWYIQIQTSTMLNKTGRLMELVRSTCSHGIKSRSWLRKPKLHPIAPSCLADVGVPVLHRRAYSSDSLSFGPGWPTLGSSSQQNSVERTSPSSALRHRNLSAVAIQVGRCLRLGFF